MLVKEKLIEKIISKLNENQEEIIGIELPNGKRIPAKNINHLIRFKNWTVLNRTLKDLEMGFAEGYMEGDIEILGDLEKILIRGISFSNETQNERLFSILKSIIPSKKENDKKNIKHHYDLGNDFYKLFLDKSMTYSCAFFENPQMDLEEAQRLKRKIIFEKLQLKENDTLLDIGCGWGSIIIESAQIYGLKSVGITLSKNQYEYIKNLIKSKDLEDRVEVHFLHYEDLPKLNKKFTKVVSVGMFEHVGKENYTKFFKTVYNVMDEKGLFLLHTIGKMHPESQSRWIRKYIFPGGYLPSISEIMRSLSPLQFKFYLVDFDNWRIHYYWTLKKWKENFYSNIDKIKQMFDDRFIRMWDLYLTSSAASFLIGSNYVFQILLSKGVNNRYPIIERKFIHFEDPLLTS